MFALISPNEIVRLNDNILGQRVAQTEQNPFPVAQPLFWTECTNDVIADMFYWNGQEILPIPIINNESE